MIAANQPPSAESAHEPRDIAPVLVALGWSERTEQLGSDLLWQTWTSPNGTSQVRYSPAGTDDFTEWFVTRGQLRFTATEGTPAAVISALALAPVHDTAPPTTTGPARPPTALENFDQALMRLAADRAAHDGLLRAHPALDPAGNHAEVLAASLRELSEAAAAAAAQLLAADPIPA